MFGLIWIVGRVLYLQGYMRAPEQRSTGYLITMLATAGLLVLAVIGARSVLAGAARHLVAMRPLGDAVDLDQIAKQVGHVLEPEHVGGV